MDITGTITKKLDKVSGTSANGQWQKQEFVIKTEDQYPKDVCINTWGPKVDDLVNFSEGNRVKVFFNVSSREFKEKWYTELQAWKIELADGGQQTPPPPVNYNSAPIQNSAPVTNNSSNTQEDDLPF